MKENEENKGINDKKASEISSQILSIDIFSFHFWLSHFILAISHTLAHLENSRRTLAFTWIWRKKAKESREHKEIVGSVATAGLLCR